VREHIMQLARDPAALGDCRRTGLLIARILKLGHQQLGPVLALPRPPEEERHDPQQHRHQHLGRDSRRRAAGDRRDDSERYRHSTSQRNASLERQPSERQERRDPGRDAGGSLELKPGDRDTRGAHHRDHSRLQPEAALGKAVADRDQQRRGEHTQRERHRQFLAVQSRHRVAVGAAEHHHDDHRPPERTQRPSLAMQALLSPRPSLSNPLAVRP
jgi:hypothetical protein